MIAMVTGFAFTSLEEVTIPDTVTSIGSSFLESVHATKLTISLNTLRTADIDPDAFIGSALGDANITCEIILTDVDGDITLLENGVKEGDREYIFEGKSTYDSDLCVTKVLEPEACTITNQTGAEVEVVLEDGTSVTILDGNAKPVGAAAVSDAYLESLAVDASFFALTLDPDFSNLTQTYTANVGNEVASVWVTARPSGPAAAVTINGETADSSNDHTVEVALEEGENTISIVVTAQDQTSLTYTVTVTRSEGFSKHLTISTPEELMDFAAKINDGTYPVDSTLDMVVELTADLDMSEYDWIPIGISLSQYFGGIFDGNDHTISNLKMSNHKAYGSFLGLFGATGADIRDVHVTGEFLDQSDRTTLYYFGPIVGFTNGNVIGCTAEFTVHGEDGTLRGYPIGGVVGFISGVDETPLKLENCVSYTAISGALANPAFIGGVSGVSQNAEIINCRNDGTISISKVPSYVYIGGILGQTQTGTVLDHCINNGAITHTDIGGMASIGGICGRVSTPTKITCCTNNGALDTNADDAGGILGAAYYGGAVEDCVIEGCLNNGAVSSGANYACVAGIGSAFGGDGAIDITANISLGELSAAGQNATVHPAATEVSNPDSATLSSNYYNESIQSQGTVPDVVTAGSTGMALEALKAQETLDAINQAGGNFRLDENGEIEVAPLRYSLTIADKGEESTGEGEYEAGETVTIYAGTKSGYTFAGWESNPENYANPVVFDDPASAQTTFTMPDEAVTVTALWERIYVLRYDITVSGTENGTVKAPANGVGGVTVTITVTPDEGYELNALTVTDRSGKELKLTDKGDGKYSFTMPSSAVTVKAAFKATGSTGEDGGLPFTDVEEGGWYYEAAECVWEKGMMNGVSDTLFAPGTTLTRSMIVTILYRLEGEPEAEGESTFADVAAGTWYTGAVAWAAANEIVNGYGNGLFRPEDNITREQMAAILYRYAQYKAYDVSGADDLSAFTDGENTSEWAMEAMQWAVGSGLLQGKAMGCWIPPAPPPGRKRPRS